MDNLADKFIEFLDTSQHLHELPTWDDFFDEVDIPKKARTDFACAAIMKQVKERIK